MRALLLIHALMQCCNYKVNDFTQSKNNNHIFSWEVSLMLLLLDKPLLNKLTIFPFLNKHTHNFSIKIFADYDHCAYFLFIHPTPFLQHQSLLAHF